MATEVNASLLGSGGGNLGSLALAVRQQNMNEQDQQIRQMKEIGNAVDSIKEVFTNDEINDSLRKNFDPETQTLNEKGVIGDLFNAHPQKALAFQQQFQANKVAQMKAQNEAMKSQAEVGKIQAETGKFNADSEKTRIEGLNKGLDQSIKMLQAVPKGDQAGFDRMIRFAQSQGLPVENYIGRKYDENTRNELLNLAVDAKDQLDLNIKQQQADAGTMTAQASLANSVTNQERVTNDNINEQNRNAITMRGQDKQLQSTQMTVDAQREKAQEVSPELKFRQQEAAEKNNAAIREAKVQLDGANRAMSSIEKEAGNLKSSPVTNMSSERLILSANTPILSNEVKQFKARFDMLYRQVTGATLQNIRAQSQTGASGYGQLTAPELPIVASGGEALPFDDWVNLSPQDRIIKLENLENAARESQQINNNIIKDHESRKKTNEVQQPSKPQSFKAENGVTLSPAEQREMARIRGL